MKKKMRQSSFQSFHSPRGIVLSSNQALLPVPTVRRRVSECHLGMRGRDPALAYSGEGGPGCSLRPHSWSFHCWWHPGLCCCACCALNHLKMLGVWMPWPHTRTQLSPGALHGPLNTIIDGRVLVLGHTFWHLIFTFLAVQPREGTGLTGWERWLGSTALKGQLVFIKKLQKIYHTVFLKTECDSHWLGAQKPLGECETPIWSVPPPPSPSWSTFNSRKELIKRGVLQKKKEQ